MPSRAVHDDVEEQDAADPTGGVEDAPDPTGGGAVDGVEDADPPTVGMEDAEDPPPTFGLFLLLLVPAQALGLGCSPLRGGGLDVERTLSMARGTLANRDANAPLAGGVLLIPCFAREDGGATREGSFLRSSEYIGRPASAIFACCARLPLPFSSETAPLCSDVTPSTAEADELSSSSSLLNAVSRRRGPASSMQRISISTFEGSQHISISIFAGSQSRAKLANILAVA